MNALNNQFVPNNNLNPTFNSQMNNNNNNGFNKKRKAESTFTCTICSIEVGSQDVLTSHMNGQKHAKRLRQIAVTTKSATSLDSAQAQPSQNGSATNTQATATASVIAVDAPALPTSQTTGQQNKLFLQELNELASFHNVNIFKILIKHLVIHFNHYGSSIFLNNRLFR